MANMRLKKLIGIVFCGLISVSLVFPVIAAGEEPEGKPAYEYEQETTEEAEEDSEEEDGEEEEPSEEEETEVVLSKYRIKFNANGGKGTMKAQTIKVGAKKKLRANAFEKTGYHFAGWSLVKNPLEMQEETKELVKEEAKAEAEEAETNEKASKDKEAEDEIVILADKANPADILTGDKSTINLYAQWEPNTYNIVFIGVGSKSPMAKLEYGKTYKLDKNTFKMEGKTFAGWNTEKDGSGKSYADGAKIKSLTAKDKGTVMLYAQWK